MIKEEGVKRREEIQFGWVFIFILFFLKDDHLSYSTALRGWGASVKERRRRWERKETTRKWKTRGSTERGRRKRREKKGKKKEGYETGGGNQ